MSKQDVSGRLSFMWDLTSVPRDQHDAINRAAMTLLKTIDPAGIRHLDSHHWKDVTNDPDFPLPSSGYPDPAASVAYVNHKLNDLPGNISVTGTGGTTEWCIFYPLPPNPPGCIEFCYQGCGVMLDGGPLLIGAADVQLKLVLTFGILRPIKPATASVTATSGEAGLVRPKQKKGQPA